MWDWMERAGFRASLHSPWFFRKVVRPELYKRAEKRGVLLKGMGRPVPDVPELVHQLALEMVQQPEFGSILREYEEAGYFSFPELEININGQYLLPFGNAAGFTKDCEALGPLSRVLGFVTVGSVVMPVREGNQPMRIHVDDKAIAIRNAQGFPSKGWEYALEHIKKYGGQKPLVVNMSGIPGERGITEAREQMEFLLKKFGPYATMFEWNPFSPNTASLNALRKPAIFKEYAQLVRKEIGEEKLALVKMGPYEEAGREEWLELVKGWMDGGGDGITAVNTRQVSLKEDPRFAGWKYPSPGDPKAGISGPPLEPYRNRAIADSRKTFGKEIVIFAAGGATAENAYDIFRMGADAVEAYTDFAFYGLGEARKMMAVVRNRLKRDGYRSLEELRQQR